MSAPPPSPGPLPPGPLPPGADALQARLAFARGVLGAPEDPLRRADWAALAFDRERHAEGAPGQAWHAWLAIAARAGTRRVQAIARERLAEGEGLRQAVLPADYAAVGDWLREHLRYAEVAWLMDARAGEGDGLGEGWLVRIDREHALLAAPGPRVADVLERLGGRDAALGLMCEDFEAEAGSGDPVDRWLRGLLRASRRD